MRKVIVPIFTEEYSVDVYLGRKNELAKAISENTGYSLEEATEMIDKTRGQAYNCLPGNDPVILVRTEKQFKKSVIATLAHEASHCMDYISEHLSLNHTEFKAYGVAAIMRVAGKYLKK